jgi:transposase
MTRQRLPIVAHLPPEEIARHARTCRHPVEKTHWQALWLLTRSDDPLTPAQVAAALGLTPGWVRKLLKRWNAGGPTALADRRAANGGRAKLTPERQAELLAALKQPAPDGGLWTGPKVARYVRGRWGVEVVPQTGWSWLRALGFTLQVPRPRHPRAATPAQTRVWKRRPRPAARTTAAGRPRPAGRGLGRG